MRTRIDQRQTRASRAVPDWLTDLFNRERLSPRAQTGVAVGLLSAVVALLLIVRFVVPVASGGTSATPDITVPVGQPTVATTASPGVDPADPADPAGDTGGIGLSDELTGTNGQPVAVATRKDDPRLYVASRFGVITLLLAAVDDGTGAVILSNWPTSIDLSKGVDAGATKARDEGGMRGLAFTRDGNWLLVSYVGVDGHLDVDAYAMAGGNLAYPQLNRRISVVSIPNPSRTAYGGAISVDADGRLWLGIGTMADPTTDPGVAQDPTTLAGSIVRLDIRRLGLSGFTSLTSLAVPSAQAEVWARGLHEPTGITFDEVRQRVWIVDAGTTLADEINETSMVGAGVRNFGSDLAEGPVRLRGVPPSNAISAIASIRLDRKCQAVPGIVYQSQLLPDISGGYLYGDTCTGAVRAIVVDPTGAATRRDLVTLDKLSAIGVDFGGAPLALPEQGGVYRLDQDHAAARAKPVPIPRVPDLSRVTTLCGMNGALSAIQLLRDPTLPRAALIARQTIDALGAYSKIIARTLPEVADALPLLDAYLRSLSANLATPTAPAVTQALQNLATSPLAGVKARDAIFQNDLDCVTAAFRR